jgi:hypothetical protein
LPENRGCCFSWMNCYRCGVSNHDRKTQCFDKSYLNNIACCECWVFKNVPGSKRHDITDCSVHGRLRRLLSHHFMTTRESKNFPGVHRGNIYLHRNILSILCYHRSNVYDCVNSVHPWIILQALLVTVDTNI